MATFDEFYASLGPDIGVRGKQFEKFVKWFLKTDPTWATQIDEVWLWNEYPKRWGADCGIDLIFTHKNGKTWAVQSKCVSPNNDIKKFSNCPKFYTLLIQPNFGCSTKAIYLGVKNLRDGIEIVLKELKSILDKNQIKKIEPLHEKFDYNFHQAMYEAPSTEYDEGLIFEVVQPGYILHDRLIRPAMVGVSKGKIEEKEKKEKKNE